MATVQDIQSKLNTLGFGPLTVDGANGPKTQAAVKAFQSSKGLTVDGVVGPQTLSALGMGDTPGAVPTGGSTTLGKSFVSVAAPAISGIKQAVVDAFAGFSEGFEGYTDFMYPDSKGLVTTGIGNLIDSVGAAQALPWVNADGSAASAADVAAAWQKVKAAYPGVQSFAAKPLTTIRLTKTGIAKLVNDKMRANHGVLVKRYPNYTSWPADAQLALHSLSWAWGPAFSTVWGVNGQHFDSDVNALRPDFTSASSLMGLASQHEESINSGIIPRDAANRGLWSNADKVLSGNGDPEKLYYPLAFSAKAISAFAVGGLVVGTGIAIGISKYKGWI